MQVLQATLTGFNTAASVVSVVLVVVARMLSLLQVTVLGQRCFDATAWRTLRKTEISGSGLLSD